MSEDDHASSAPGDLELVRAFVNTRDVEDDTDEVGTAEQLTAWLAGHGLPVSTYTPSFLTAIVLGAGTDYAVFLIARHRSALRAAADGRGAARRSLRDLMPVLVASAATIMIGSSASAE